MPSCETYTATEAREKFSEVISKALHKGPVVITRGNDTVAVVPIELLRLLSELEAQSDAKEATKALREYEERGGTRLDVIKKELGIE